MEEPLTTAIMPKDASVKERTVAAPTSSTDLVIVFLPELALCRVQEDMTLSFRRI
jgi:hypothetical protein